MGKYILCTSVYMPSKSVCSALVAEHSYGYETVYYYALRIYKCASVSSSQQLTIMAVSSFVNIHNVVTFHSHCITLDHIGSHWITLHTLWKHLPHYICITLHYSALHHITAHYNIMINSKYKHCVLLILIVYSNVYM